jgi:hypothetical protein
VTSWPGACLRAGISSCCSEFPPISVVGDPATPSPLPLLVDRVCWGDGRCCALELAGRQSVMHYLINEQCFGNFIKAEKFLYDELCDVIVSSKSHGRFCGWWQ